MGRLLELKFTFASVNLIQPTLYFTLSTCIFSHLSLISFFLSHFQTSPMASKQREPLEAYEPETKKAKLIATDSSKPEPNHRVQLNPADCDLDFEIEENGLQGKALYEEGFAYCWSGARASVGIRGGKYCFGCKVIAVQPVDMKDIPLEQQNVCRVGVSRGDDAVRSLGETPHSFGYGGTGKFSSDGKFLNFGEKFSVEDTIVCAVDLESKPLGSVGFSKNGKWLGVAKTFDAKGLGVVDTPVNELQWESALFPHVLLKNVVVKLQFSVEDGLVPEEGYKPWDCAFRDGNAIMGPVFSETKDCEVMMMVGLPASGKTTWAEKQVKDHPEKRYILLGTNLALDHMKVFGLLRKQNYKERFEQLMDRATGIFNTLLKKAADTPRNFIIDQTNVYKSARKRKLKPFFRYRKIAVVVFPRPDELKIRAESRFKEMGKVVPAEAVNEMLANYVLPKSKDMPASDEHFDEVIFTELGRSEAQRCLEEMKLALGSANLPYSRGSSVQSFASSLPPSQGSLAATDGHLQNFVTPFPPQSYEYHHPSNQLMSQARDRMQRPQASVSGGYQSGSSPGAYENYAGFDYNQRLDSQSRSPVPGGSTGVYRNYGGLDSYGTPYSGSRSSFPADATEPYQGQGEAPNGAPNFSGRTTVTPIPGSVSNTHWNHRGITPTHWNHRGITPYDRPDFERASSLVFDFGGQRAPYPNRNLEDSQFASPVMREHAFPQRGPPYGIPPPALHGNLPTTGRHQSDRSYAPRGPRYY